MIVLSKNMAEEVFCIVSARHLVFGGFAGFAVVFGVVVGKGGGGVVVVFGGSSGRELVCWPGPSSEAQLQK